MSFSACIEHFNLNPVVTTGGADGLVAAAQQDRFFYICVQPLGVKRARTKAYHIVLMKVTLPLTQASMLQAESGPGSTLRPSFMQRQSIGNSWRISIITATNAIKTEIQ